MILPVILELESKTLLTYAIIDIGAEGKGFINQSWAASHELPLKKLKKPFELKVFDGKNAKNGIITYYVKTRLKTKNHCEKIKFFVTQLAYYPVILGMPWLKKHDPKIGFANHIFTFNSEYYRKHCNTPARPIKIKILHDIPTKARPHNLPPRPSELRHLNITKMLLRACTIYNRRNCQLFTVIIEDINRYLQNASPPKPPDLLPEKLKNYADVFSPKEAEKLPPHRNYNHNIRLQEDKTPPFEPLYPMFRNKLIALKEWLEKNLRKGFIRPSSSPAASPILFVKKTNENLRFYVNYRKLNNISVKNRYPLPLTKKSLNNLKKMKYFTKIDITFAFNNIRMRKRTKIPNRLPDPLWFVRIPNDAFWIY
jgi:hypothetical protein